jgi:hypothetical protein
MSKRHFEFVAECIKAQAKSWGQFEAAGDVVMAAFAKDLATALAQTNPNFNRQRFLEACGIGAENERT